ncbi:hypothetical protein Vafri_6659 [Volvox africanus]|uniref:Uncharacterized protein n=1 Tax=Volvox africanus TaxID=51714 RepID=A0A8J4AZ38_9CHLO|nr:hypothetical protein Vafri_6659 [Volvox africanus]
MSHAPTATIPITTNIIISTTIMPTHPTHIHIHPRPHNIIHSPLSRMNRSTPHRHPISTHTVAPSAPPGTPSLYPLYGPGFPVPPVDGRPRRGTLRPPPPPPPRPPRPLLPPPVAAPPVPSAAAASPNPPSSGSLCAARDSGSNRGGGGRP